jgi:N-acetylmuramoyl-L-alanine amidase
VAARENSVVLHAKDKISKNVILNLMTGPKIVMSNKLAIDVQRGMLRNLRRKFKGVKDNGVRPAPFWVLVGAQMPSVLVETGYITHPKEKKRIFNPRYQERIAKGIAEGISNYFANREKEME